MRYYCQLTLQPFHKLIMNYLEKICIIRKTILSDILIQRDETLVHNLIYIFLRIFSKNVFQKSYFHQHAYIKKINNIILKF